LSLGCTGRAPSRTRRRPTWIDNSAISHPSLSFSSCLTWSALFLFLFMLLVRPLPSGEGAKELRATRARRGRQCTGAANLPPRASPTHTIRHWNCNSAPWAWTFLIRPPPARPSGPADKPHRRPLEPAGCGGRPARINDCAGHCAPIGRLHEATGPILMAP